jgi:hypothetical protein
VPARVELCSSTAPHRTLKALTVGNTPPPRFERFVVLLARHRHNCILYSRVLSKVALRRGHWQQAARPRVVPHHRMPPRPVEAPLCVAAKTCHWAGSASTWQPFPSPTRDSPACFPENALLRRSYKLFGEKSGCWVKCIRGLTNAYQRLKAIQDLAPKGIRASTPVSFAKASYLLMSTNLAFIVLKGVILLESPLIKASIYILV